METCINKECEDYDAKSINSCNKTPYAEECDDFKSLKARKEPVAEVPCSDQAMPDADDMESIKVSLERECAYSDEEIDDMLKNANFKCHKDGIDITYDNGIVDNFIYVKVLVHSSEANKVRLRA